MYIVSLRKLRDHSEPFVMLVAEDEDDLVGGLVESTFHP